MITDDEERREAWLLGRLSAEDAAAVRREMADPAVAQALVRQAGEIVALRVALRGQAGVRGEGPTRTAGRRRRSQPLPRRMARRPRLPWALVAGVMACLLGVAVWLLRSDPPAPAADPVEQAQVGHLADRPPWEVVEAGPGINRGNGRLAIGDGLPAESKLTTTSAQRLRLRHRQADIDLVLLGPFHLELLDGSSLRCQRGELRVTVGRRQPGDPFAVATPHAHCTVLGTRFQVTVSPEETELQVSEGRVAFQPRTTDGELRPARIVTAGASALSAAATTVPVPLVAYPLEDGSGALAGTGRLQHILPLTMERSPQWTGQGLRVDAEHHLVTPTNASWPSLREALVASRAVTLSCRVRSHAPVSRNQLLAALYIRMAGEQRRRLITLMMVDEKAPSDWLRWSITVAPDGSMRTYRGAELVRNEMLEHWPPAPDDQSIQLKLLEPLGHHGEPNPDLAIEFADVLIFDRALEPDELRRLAH